MHRYIRFVLYNVTIFYSQRPEVCDQVHFPSGYVKHLQQPRARDDGQGDPGDARREAADREGVPGKSGSKILWASYMEVPKHNEISHAK